MLTDWFVYAKLTQRKTVCYSDIYLFKSFFLYQLLDFFTPEIKLIVDISKLQSYPEFC